MMKKTIIASMVLATSLLATPVMAESNFGVDLESMSLEDLVSLKDAVNEQIAAKGGDNVLGEGLYEVGTDIKAGGFKITCYKGNSHRTVRYIIYNSIEAYDAHDALDMGNVDYDESLGNAQEVAQLNLKDGQILKLEYGSAIVDDTKPSWAPED